MCINSLTTPRLGRRFRSHPFSPGASRNRVEIFRLELSCKSHSRLRSRRKGTARETCSNNFCFSLSAACCNWVALSGEARARAMSTELQLPQPCSLPRLLIMALGTLCRTLSSPLEDREEPAWQEHAHIMALRHFGGREVIAWAVLGSPKLRRPSCTPGVRFRLAPSPSLSGLEAAPRYSEAHSQAQEPPKAGSQPRAASNLLEALIHRSTCWTSRRGEGGPQAYEGTLGM